MHTYGKLIGAIAATFLWTTLSTAFAADMRLVFNTTAPTNDLKGELAAQILFAQSQIVPARPREGDSQPHLIGRRKCLLLVRPIQADGANSMQVAAFDKDGNQLGVLTLAPPTKLPKTAYYLDDLPDEPIDFTTPAVAGRVINSGSELKKLSDPRDAFLHDWLRKNALVEIQTADARWVRDIHLPQGADLEGKMIRVRSSAGYSSTLHYSGRTAVISRDQSLQFKFVRGQWVLEGELENQQLVYAADAWSGVAPAEWIAPGLRLRFRQGELNGELSELMVGAPTELLIHTIDVGMLVPPRDRFEFAKDSTAHREYFQTAPTSRLIVNQYAPLHLREVMLPNGTMLSDVDPSKGDWHNGTMRQRIGKELISHGIDNANYGLHSTAGEGEDSHPYAAAQLAAHNSSGKYSNGIVVHGGSGGGGIVTLDDTLGNEFSHEVGHNYGLGHYVGGFRGSVHRSAEQINSTWGWDADKNRFIPNFAPTRSGKDACLEDQCQSPFHGRTFGLDAMAGGAPLSRFNRFTLYTPHSAAVIQKFLESKAVFDAASPTGFSKWNAELGRMTPYSHRINVAEQKDAKASDPSESKVERKPRSFGVPVTTLVGYYDPQGELNSYLYPALHGAYGFSYGDDRERLSEQDCQLVVETREGTLRFRLANHRIKANVMNKFHVNIPTSSRPRSASLICRGKVVDNRTIPAAPEELKFTIQP